MPANPKYLNPLFWPRLTKISATIVGSYLVTVSFHLALASWFNRADVIMTMAFSGFIVWAILMVVTFLAKSGLRIWGLYLLLTLIFSGLTYAGQYYNR